MLNASSTVWHILVRDGFLAYFVKYKLGKMQRIFLQWAGQCDVKAGSNLRIKTFWFSFVGFHVYIQTHLSGLNAKFIRTDEGNVFTIAYRK